MNTDNKTSSYDSALTLDRFFLSLRKINKLKQKCKYKCIGLQKSNKEKIYLLNEVKSLKSHLEEKIGN